MGLLLLPKQQLPQRPAPPVASLGPRMPHDGAKTSPLRKQTKGATLHPSPSKVLAVQHQVPLIQSIPPANTAIRSSSKQQHKREEKEQRVPALL